MGLRVDGTRLGNSLLEMARIGATPAGGCNRQALTDEDRAGRDLFQSWAAEAGLATRIDQMGNLFARRAGTKKERSPILVGSHLDTQPTGGKFDGVYGVLAGLEVVRALNDAGAETESAIDIVVWTNEEGARFAPAMVGSGVWAGAIELEKAYAETAADGATLAEELKRIGYLGPEPAQPFPVHGAFELHIEQGPILEAEGDRIGVVTGVQGMRWYDIAIDGTSCHAGTTPMDHRKDPVQSLTRVLDSLFAQLPRFGAAARATVGVLRSDPASRNTVPSQVTASVDLRHPESTELDAMEQALRQTLENICREHGTQGSLSMIWDSPPVEFDPRCVEAIHRAVGELGCTHREMVSGAGHDSVYVSRVAPTAMIFVPCLGGLSHNEAESASPEDLEAGCNVLLHAVLERDRMEH